MTVGVSVATPVYPQPCAGRPRLGRPGASVRQVRRHRVARLADELHLALRRDLEGPDVPVDAARRAVAPADGQLHAEAAVRERRGDPPLRRPDDVGASAGSRPRTCRFVAITSAAASSGVATEAPMGVGVGRARRWRPGWAMGVAPGPHAARIAAHSNPGSATEARDSFRFVMAVGRARALEGSHLRGVARASGGRSHRRRPSSARVRAIVRAPVRPAPLFKLVPTKRNQRAAGRYRPNDLLDRA